MTSLHIVLFEPQIPPNTGNIIRLAANTGCQLHLIHPLGFSWDTKALRRAGLDYHQFVDIKHHDNFQLFQQQHQGRILAISTQGKQHYSDIDYQNNDALLFGAETHGLSDEAKQNANHLLRIPMLPNQRSLNLSNSVAIILYEALRQCCFPNLI
ncbi:MAG: tRNA (cytidine(34)-2'-O)-methyltransferase [Candidatus Comchoanobacterales bacterium]